MSEYDKWEYARKIVDWQNGSKKIPLAQKPIPHPIEINLNNKIKSKDCIIFKMRLLIREI
jgi:hypothetical protein